MKAYLTRCYKFSASHRLHCDDMSAAENQQTYGKCNNPHGHDYALEVTVSGSVNDVTGMVCDVGELDGFVDREILQRYGHSNLNHLEEFSKSVPTTENLCAKIFEHVQNGFGAAKLERIRVQ